MTICFDVSEAFMAVGITIISADERCTAQETAMMLEMFKTLNILTVAPDKDYEEVWEALFDRTLNKINRAFPDRNLSLNETQLTLLMAAILKSIPQDRTETLFRLAVAVAVADGIEPRELAIIKQLKKALEIDPELTRKIVAESKAMALKS
ncbi:tellurite resistance TerB family protein [Oscillatoriales cyanobacterium LEGE 11467]|uniref:Tellurite resistance TerB family protein n=1 Tax=Zarconia navalis LEGE 11467 TaxID=1828826 RepID=A0A928VT44_9CYAN|nr:tellurite resistance TerB family protein [Zarconia navalis]MBE9039666.1 tellurite resistance TerB family protein [Zarconia navalis LEGE 11467]